MVVLAREDLHASAVDPEATTMTFLNEVAARFPDAISLAAGRPHDSFLDPESIARHIGTFTDHLRQRGLSERSIATVLMQYGRTNGFIGDLVAGMLAVDEDISVSGDAIVMTTGCQEGMIIALRALCARPGDVLLAASPCYVGITGAARILGIDVVPVPEDDDGVNPADVARIAAGVRAQGRRPRALYLVPDFANPSGTCMSVERRAELVATAAEQDILILEDDPYGLFGLDDRPRPKLKAIDTEGVVIYLGSFAKTFFPGARLGFMVADQRVIAADGTETLLADELATIKSMLTVNTSAISQAAIGGMLLAAGGSVRAANQDKIQLYRRNLTALLGALDREFPAPERDALGIAWKAPAGGFFVVVSMPLACDVALLEIAAKEYGVLWTPMRFFYGDGGGTHAMRLSCSALEVADIDEGVRRLAQLVRARL